MLDWLGDLLRRLFGAIPSVPNAKWIILGIAILAVVAIAARFVFANEAEERRRRARSRTVFGGADPLIEAERLAAAGDYTEAAHLLYRAVTERLAAAEQIRLHPSKTSGDYARELRTRGSSSYQPFREFSRRFDVAVFGHGGCDAVLIDDLRRLAAPFTARARAA